MDRAGTRRAPAHSPGSGASGATGPCAPRAVGVRHPDRDDDVGPAVEDLAIALPEPRRARGPVSRRLLIQAGVAAAAAAGSRVEVRLAVRDLDRLDRTAGNGPPARRAPDELLDVPGSSLPFVFADAEGDTPRLRGRGREGGRGQHRGARERRDERAAHRGSFEHVWFHPRDGPGWRPGPRRAPAGVRSRLAVGRGCWITSSGSDTVRPIDALDRTGPGSPAPRASAIHGRGGRRARGVGEERTRTSVFVRTTVPAPTDNPADPESQR